MKITKIVCELGSPKNCLCQGQHWSVLTTIERKCGQDFRKKRYILNQSSIASVNGQRSPDYIHTQSLHLFLYGGRRLVQLVKLCNLSAGYLSYYALVFVLDFLPCIVQHLINQAFTHEVPKTQGRETELQQISEFPLILYSSSGLVDANKTRKTLSSATQNLCPICYFFFCVTYFTTFYQERPSS